MVHFVRRRLRAVVLACCCLPFALYAQPSPAEKTAAAAKTNESQQSPASRSAPGRATGALSSEAAGLLQDWDDKQSKLRRAIWNTYSWTAAFGRDDRGRSVSDDLNQWVMTPAVRQQLGAFRKSAENQFRKGNEKAARETLDSGNAILLEQTLRLVLVETYWTQRRYLERQRALWLQSLNAAPSDVALTSRARITPLAAALSHDLSPDLKLEKLNEQIGTLEAAYNEERLKLAAIVSDKQVAAGQVIAHRNRDFPCPAPTQSPAGVVTTGKSETSPPHLLSAPASDKFYPNEARRAGIAGKVVLKLALSKEGCMTAAQVIRSSGAPEIDDAAINLAERSSFAPARKRGSPVESDYSVTFAFQLSVPGSGSGASPPAAGTAAWHVQHGNELLDKGDNDGAIAEMDKALQLDPTAARALAYRGLAHMWKRETELARKDFDGALALDPRNVIVFRGRGLLALRNGELDQAAASFTQALEVRPDDYSALTWRAETYLRTGDPGRARTDISELVVKHPDRPEPYQRLAFVLRVLHKPEEALELAHAVIAANPDKSSAYRVAGAIYSGGGKRDEAALAFDKAIELEANELNYVARMQHRAPADLVGKRSDLQAALKLDAHALIAAPLLIQMQTEAGDYSAAIATATEVLAANAGNSLLLLRRGIAYLKSHEPAKAEQDFAAARDKATTASALNTVCWTLATAGVELDAALAACDKALALAPLEPMFLDSRGFVLARLGRYAEALESYDAAVKYRPFEPDTLYCRGLVRRHLGDGLGADADIEAALALQSRVDEVVAGYGLSSS